MSRRDRKEHLVWSSEPAQARPTERGGTSLESSKAYYAPPEKQVARLSRSRRGRAGKTVVVIEGLELPPEGYRALAHELRQALGTGGTVKDRVIEIQGDMRDRVADLLAAHGYRTKLVGG